MSADVLRRDGEVNGSHVLLSIRLNLVPSLETMVTTRDGGRMDDPEPAPAGNGAALADALEQYVGALDDSYADDVLSAHELVAGDDPWAGQAWTPVS